MGNAACIVVTAVERGMDVNRGMCSGTVMTVCSVGWKSVGGEATVGWHCTDGNGGTRHLALDPGLDSGQPLNTFECPNAQIPLIAVFRNLAARSSSETTRDGATQS